MASTPKTTTITDQIEELIDDNRVELDATPFSVIEIVVQNSIVDGIRMKKYIKSRNRGKG